MRKLAIFCRHGNTFNSGEKVVTVGARHDLPLTSVGEEQARVLGTALRESGLEIESVFAGPLIRTRDFAKIAMEEGQIAGTPFIDQRLIELDYGAWEGLSDQEIEAHSGLACLDAWRHRGIRPAHVTFCPAADVLEREMRTLLEELSRRAGNFVVITSNGRLREVGRQYSNAVGTGSEERSWKVGTGRVCILEYLGSAWKIVDWDVAPERIRDVVRRSPC